MAVDETLLDEIVRRVLAVARPDRIILFGSAATGQMTKDSDIDLLVIEPAPANTRGGERPDSRRCWRCRLSGGCHRNGETAFRTNQTGDWRDCLPGKQIRACHLCSRS